MRCGKIGRCDQARLAKINNGGNCGLDHEHMTWLWWTTHTMDIGVCRMSCREVHRKFPKEGRLTGSSYSLWRCVLHQHFTNKPYMLTGPSIMMTVNIRAILHLGKQCRKIYAGFRNPDEADNSASFIWRIFTTWYLSTSSCYSIRWLQCSASY